MLKALDTLSSKNRQATLLFYQEQLSLQQVADRLNISVSAVKGRLYKSRHQLRKQLLPYKNQIQSIQLQEKKMTNNTVNQTKIELCCSFCRKDKEQVELLIAGPSVYICNHCVDICNQIISEESTTKGEVESTN